MFKFDKKYLYIILGVFVLFNIYDRFTNQTSLLTLILTLPAILLAITFHEFAHAFAADKLGDETPRNQGRLTLNPLKHIDPVGFALLIVAGFGWGKPVQVNPYRFKRDISMTKAEAIVSFAGPLMNLILAILSVIFLTSIIKFNLFTNLSAQVYSLILIFLIQFCTINIGLCIFNLIPLPPLDGSKILYHFISEDKKEWFIRNEQILYIVFVGIWITGIAGKIITPCISGVLKGIFFIVGKLFNIDIGLI